MKKLELKQMEEIQGGGGGLECAFASVGLAAAFAGLAVATGGIGLYAAAVGFAVAPASWGYSLCTTISVGIGISKQRKEERKR